MVQLKHVQAGARKAMTTTERLIIWPIGITILLIGGIAGLLLCALWSVARALAGFADWVREDA